MNFKGFKSRDAIVIFSVAAFLFTMGCERKGPPKRDPKPKHYQYNTKLRKKQNFAPGKINAHFTPSKLKRGADNEVVLIIMPPEDADRFAVHFVVTPGNALIEGEKDQVLKVKKGEEVKLEYEIHPPKKGTFIAYARLFMKSGERRFVSEVHLK